MFQWFLVAMLSAMLLGQQPQGLVKQTELAPPGARKASAPSAAAGNEKPRVESAAPAESPEPLKRPEGTLKLRGLKDEAAPKETESKPKTEATPPAAQKTTKGNHVAAFWFISPGK